MVFLTVALAAMMTSEMTGKWMLQPVRRCCKGS